MKPQNNRDHLAMLLIGLAAFLFAYFLVFKFPFTPIFLESDHLIFVYEAGRLLHGDVMYRDFFEFTMPGTQLFYLALFSIFGEKFSVLSFTIVGLAVITTLLSFEISRRTIAGRLRFLPPLIWLFFGFRWFGLDGSHRMFSAVFVLLAVFAVMHGSQRKNLVLAGVFLGFASFFTQQRGFVVLVAIGLFLVIEAYKTRKGFRDGAGRIATVAGVFAIVLSALSAYFVFVAGAHNFFHDTVVYPLEFYGHAPSNSYSVFFTDVTRAASVEGLSGRLFLTASVFYAWLLPIGLIVALIFIPGPVRRGEWISVRAPFLLIVVAVLLFTTTVGPNAVRFFQVGVLALVVVCWLVGRLRFSNKVELSLAAFVGLVLVAIGAVQAVRMQTNWESRLIETASGQLAFMTPEQAEFYADIAAKTHPGDIIYESVQPYVYFPFGLRNPTKMSQVWPFDYTQSEQVAEVVEDLRHAQPEYIAWDNSNNKPDADRTPGDHLGPLADYVNSAYAPDGPVYDLDGHPLQLWRRKNN